MWQLFREFFDLAERRRRWKVADDIPWDECNPALKPVVADVVETFCAVELYLPDYSAKILPKVRHSKGRAWFYANWGYEESKHSLALGDWLLKSGHRSEEYMADLERKVFAREWNLPQDDHLGHARLRHGPGGGDVPQLPQPAGPGEGHRRRPGPGKDAPAHGGGREGPPQLLPRLPEAVPGVRPAAVVDQLRRVMNEFQMPAIHDLLDESPRRVAAIRELELFDADMYYREVYRPILAELGVTRQEMRTPRGEKKSLRVGLRPRKISAARPQRDRT